MTNQKDTRAVRSLALVVLLAVLCVGSTALASEESSESHGGHGYHPHHVALFAGVTSFEHLEEPAIGLDYEYRFHQNWGVGALVDYAGGDFDAWVYAGALFIHPVGGLTFTIAPGVESRVNDLFLVRVGVGYSFHIGDRMSLFPNYNIDFVSGAEIQVYGLAIGVGF